jgi:hypothetical protein
LGEEEVMSFDTDTTKLIVEFLPGVFIGVELPTRYLVWCDDKPKEPFFNPGFRELVVSGKLSMEVER